MSDTNNMRRDFEVLLVARGASTICKSDGYGDSLSQSFWVFWQVATERATAVERDRCASAIKRESDKTVSMAVFCGVEAVDLRPYEICEAAIRQGGDT